MTIAPASNTAADIRTMVRRLTASSSESTLPTATLDQFINDFYSNDFPYAIKLDQMRSVYTFYTQPNIDRYPLDVNYNQGVRAPLYIDGIQGTFFKDRQQFYAVYPRFPTTFQPISGDGVTTVFNFTVQGPFLRGEVTLGGVDSAGNAISVADDGKGNLQLQVPNPVVSVPAQYAVDGLGNPIPGMKNLNTANPGLIRVNTTTTPFTNAIGSVNYVTGAFSINFPTPPASGTTMRLRVSQYQTGRPYALLFWNNEFSIRPVPAQIHKIEIETYLTPVQFMQTTDSPILNQWWKYIAYGVSMEILRQRQDIEGVQNLSEGFLRQEGLALERQGVEEIGQQNRTIYNSAPILPWGNWLNNGNWF